MTRSAPLAILLCLQAALLLVHLDLLPVWTDELHTVTTVAHPVAEIIPLLQRDVHPPLYFVLLHYWKMLPLPWTGPAALRAFSALWALLATLLLDRLWVRRWPPFARWAALVLFALSPCLLLYGRMARSYSMQLVLALVSLTLLRRWLLKPRSMMAAAGSAAAVSALLYTHYEPGLAVLAAFLLVGWRSVGLARAGAFALAVTAAYLPWASTLLVAFRHWGLAAGFSANYALTGTPLLEPAVKIGFGLTSLTVGESFPVGSLFLVPLMIILALGGARSAEWPRPFAALLAVAALVGYVGVQRWVSYPFIPARLVWLLPFLAMAVALGLARTSAPVRWSVAALILVSFAWSAVLYFRRQNFLNLGYTAPLREIATTLNRHAAAGDLILIDAYDTDWPGIAWLLSARTPHLVLDPPGASEAHRRIPMAATVWIARNTRDISPGRITTAVQSEACAGRPQRTILLEPFAGWQNTIKRRVGYYPQLAYFYQLTACGPGAVRESFR